MKPALLLVGHGSTRHQQSRKATERLAETLRETGRFSRVAVAFLKESPAITDALNELAQSESGQATAIWVVPNFTSHGPFTQVTIPDAVTLSSVAERVTLTDPIGTSPRITAILQRRVQRAVQCAGVAPENATLLFIGHGARKPTLSAQQARDFAAHAEAAGWAGRVQVCFLEEPPWVQQWPTLTEATATVIVIPLLTAEGLHGAGDIPPLFGIAESDLTVDGPSLIGPLLCQGRTVWYWRSLGGDPEMAEIVLDLTTERVAL